MLHPIGRVSGVVVMIDLISVIDDYGIASAIMSAIITSVVIPIVMTINSNGHYCKSSKIGRIVSVIIRWIIGHICGGIYVLHDGC